MVPIQLADGDELDEFSHFSKRFPALVPFSREPLEGVDDASRDVQSVVWFKQIA